MTTLLKALLQGRHWQKYATFCKEWDRVAVQFDPALVGAHPSRSQFARWLAGDLKNLPHPDACRILEGLFPGITAAQLFASGTVASSPVPFGLRPSGRVTPPTPTPARARGDVPPEEECVATAHSPFDRTLSEEVAMAAEDSARFVRRARGAVDHDVLDQLNADVRKVAHEYLARPPYIMLRPVSQLRAEVFGLLEVRQQPAVLPDLYRVAGQLCALLAHACADIGQAYAAETHTRTAWLCADLAEDDPLRAYVRWVQSNVAYWNGEYRRAAEHAHSGKRYATMGTSLLRLASQEARAYAAARDHKAADAALGAAQAAWSHHGSEGDDPGGVFRFAPGKAAYYASEVRLALGGEKNYRQAATDAQRAVDLFAAQPESDQCPEFFAAAQLDLVAANLALGELGDAAEHLTPVFAVPTESRTHPVVKRVAATDRALASQRYANAPLAAELRDRIRLFCTYTATRELPGVPN
ncbi:MAG: hypothetical protein ACRCYX_04030 [Dermatophilaceae bacterium]